MAYMNRGYVLKSKGNYKEAIADYNQALKIDPGYVDAYINRCDAYCDMGEYNKAGSDADSALKLKPKALV